MYTVHCTVVDSKNVLTNGWLYDGDKFQMLVTESLCWWFSLCNNSDISILNRSPTSQTCHQHIWSPTSVINIDITQDSYYQAPLEPNDRQYIRIACSCENVTEIFRNFEFSKFYGQNRPWLPTFDMITTLKMIRFVTRISFPSQHLWFYSSYLSDPLICWSRLVNSNVSRQLFKTGFSQIKIITDNIFHLAVLFFIRWTVLF